MQRADSSKRARAAANQMEEHRAGFRRQVRICNILLIIVAIEALAFDALQWWNIL